MTQLVNHEARHGNSKAWLAPYQPSQRYLVVDERHVGTEDLPVGNLMGAVLGLEQRCGPEDLERVAGRLRDPGDDGLKRAFTDWVWGLARHFEPGDADRHRCGPWRVRG